MESGDDGAVSKTAEDNVPSESQTSSSSTNSSSNGESITFEHPLLNPLIVDLVVKHLDPDFEQLKTLRLVSKVWTQVTHHHWRNTCGVLTLVPDPPLFTKTNYDYETGLPLSKFFTEFQDPQSPFQLSQKPFSKYKLKDMLFDFEVCSEPDSPSNNFWNAIGPLMESVHFYQCSFVRPVNVSHATCPLVQFLVGIIPNLKDLALTDVTTKEAGKPDQAVDQSDEDEDEDEAQERERVDREPHSNLRTLTLYGNLENNLNLDELFKSVPGLEKIKGINRISDNEQKLLKQIYCVRHYAKSEPRPLSNLKHIDLINSSALPDDDDDADDIWNSNSTPTEQAQNGTQLPLETLTLHLQNEEDPVGFGYFADNLENYLTSFSGTLKTFKAFRPPVGPPYYELISDISMSHLTELHLYGTIAPDFGFLRCTPSLKKLQIDLGCFEKRELVKERIKLQCSLYWNLDFIYEKYERDMVLDVREDLEFGILCSKLEFLEIDYNFPEESLRLLGNWMPNLKTLKTILNGDTVPVVCEVWKELTELVCLHGSKIENSCFIRDEEKAGFSGDPPPKLKICDLKDLERFQLDAYCDEAKLTDDAVFKGLLKMPGLKCVEIFVKSEMSEEAEEALKRAVPFCKVLRDSDQGCVGSSGEEILGYRCDRCAFRHDAEIYGLRDPEDDAMWRLRTLRSV